MVESGFTGHLFNPASSDNVEFWNNTTAAYERYWYDTNDGWQAWEEEQEMRDIEIGEAIWINVISGHSAFTWIYPKVHSSPPNVLPEIGD